MAHESLRLNVRACDDKSQPTQLKLGKAVVQPGDNQLFMIIPREKSDIAKAMGTVILGVDDPADDFPIFFTPQGGVGIRAFPAPAVSRDEGVNLLWPIREKAQKSDPSMTRKSAPR